MLNQANHRHYWTTTDMEWQMRVCSPKLCSWQLVIQERHGPAGVEEKQKGAIRQCSRSGLSDSSSSRNSAREEEINFNSHSEIIYDLIFFNGAEGRPESSGKLSRDPMKDSLNSIAEVNYDTTRRAKFYSSLGHHCYNNVDIWPITPLYCGEWWS